MKYLIIYYNPGIMLTAEDTVMSKNFPFPSRNIVLEETEMKTPISTHISAITELSRVLKENLAYLWESGRAPWGFCGDTSLKDK